MPESEYVIQLKRDADFWQDELTLTDEADTLVPLSSAELTIHPSDGSEAVVWNVGNGKLILPSTGVIGFSLTLEEIADYSWKRGRYCLAIEYMDGKRDGSFLRGPAKIADEC